MSIAIVSTVRTDESTLTRFLNYHFRCGVDRFFLFFDDPNDPGIERVQLDKRVHFVRCDSDHWSRFRLATNSPLEERQLCNTAQALQMARYEGIDWLLHIDTDELLFTPGHQLHRYLESHGKDVHAITFRTLEAIPKARYANHVFEEIRWFKKPRSRIPGAGKIARLLGCARLFVNGFIKGHDIGKTVVKTSAPIVAIGVHTAIASDRAFRSMVATDAYLLHFDCCTFDDWLLKWRRRHDGTATVSLMSDRRKAQLAAFIGASKSGEQLMALYRNQVPGPWQLAVLALLDLLRHITLPKRLFQ